jgi:hypothetical protein
MPVDNIVPRSSAVSGTSAYFVVAAAVALAVLAAAGLFAQREAIQHAYLWNDTGAPSLAASAVSQRGSEPPAFMAPTELVEVDLAAGAPLEVRVPVGVPIDLHVTGCGRGDIVWLRYPEAQASVRAGEAFLRLPALAPGVYPFSASAGGCAGILVAQ